MAFAMGLLATGCVNKDGDDLPEAQMAFPIAIELSPDVDAEGEPRFLYVANSNFDLQYNTGSVQSYDLEVMVQSLDELTQASTEGCTQVSPEECGQCAARGLPGDRCAITPTELDFEPPEDREDVVEADIEDLLISEVRIGSFADGMSVAPSGRRLYLPVRSDANLTFLDVNEEGQMDCGSGFEAQYQLCEREFRSGDLELVNPGDDIRVPSDPVDVFSGNILDDFPPAGGTPTGDFSGEYVIMAHREGAASFFLDQDVDGDKRPRLVATLDQLAREQVTVTYEPAARLAWIPSANTAEIVRLGIGLDGDPSQTFLFDAGPLRISGLNRGQDARDVQFDPRPGSNLAFILSRSPESIIIARRDPVGDELSIIRQVDICRGPSRLQLGLFDLEDGSQRLLAFVTCFNGRDIEIVDLDLAQGLAATSNVSGAFEFQIDTERQRMYVADFSTSTLRVFTLDPLLACLNGAVGQECSPQIQGIVGIPQAVSELPR